MSEQISILVVDDDDVLRNRLEKAFLRRGFVVYMAGDFDQAIGLAKLHGPSRAVLDPVSYTHLTLPTILLV